MQLPLNPVPIAKLLTLVLPKILPLNPNKRWQQKKRSVHANLLDGYKYTSPKGFCLVWVHCTDGCHFSLSLLGCNILPTCLPTSRLSQVPYCGPQNVSKTGDKPIVFKQRLLGLGLLPHSHELTQGWCQAVRDTRQRALPSPQKPPWPVNHWHMTSSHGSAKSCPDSLDITKWKILSFWVGMIC